MSAGLLLLVMSAVLLLALSILMFSFEMMVMMKNPICLVCLKLDSFLDENDSFDQLKGEMQSDTSGLH